MFPRQIPCDAVGFRRNQNALAAGEAFDPASGLAEPTPECRRIFNTWAGKCLFQEQKGGSSGGSNNAFDPETGLSEPTPECKRIFNTWSAKCLYGPETF